MFELSRVGRIMLINTDVIENLPYMGVCKNCNELTTHALDSKCNMRCIKCWTKVGKP